MNNQIISENRVVMVLGMARSGTSTITSGLKAIGVHLGDKLLRPDQRNPKGFYEDTDVTFKINRGILRALNYPWIAHGLAEHMRLHDDPMLIEYKNYAVELVRERLTHAACWGFKDTNTTVLLPFWQSVLSAAGAEDSYVIALRNPLGCAHSNIKHSNLELASGLLAWLKNIILAIDGSHGKKRVVVSYDLLLNNVMHELLRMRHHLAIDACNQEEMEAYAREFVDKTLHHHAYADSDLANDPAMQAVPLCLRVYHLMMRLAQDTLTFADNEFFSEWQAIKNDFARLYPLYDYAHSLSKENHILGREIRIIRKSIPWKLCYPFRLLTQAFWLKRKNKNMAQAYEW